VAGVVVIAIVAFAFWHEWTPATPAIRTIAVLPLRSLGGDEDSKAIGLGLSDTLITKLGTLKRVIIRPTNAVTPFPDQNDSLETGRRLGVDAILEGTIQKAEGKLRVNARLLNTATGQQIWADKFEEPSGGIFSLEDALSSSISQALAFELTKSDNEELHHRGTKNTDAYEMYLRGRFYQTQDTPEGFGNSIKLYQQAIAIDPNFAEAYAGLGDANVLLFNFGFGEANNTIPAARQAVDRALQLDPDLSNAYTSRALIEFLIDHDWPRAEKSLQKAINLNANNADAFVRYGFFLTNVGRFDDAIDKLGRAKDLNPLSPIVQADIGLAHLYARRYPQAIEQLEKTAADNPNFSLPEWLLAASYQGIGDTEKAFNADLKALELEGGADLAERMRKVRDAEGLDAANHFWFKETLAARQSDSEAITAALLANRAAAIKDREQTLDWIEKAREEDDPLLFEIKYLSDFDFVRDDPRFQAVAATLPS
jgi:TolB-like protein/lipoprotein NlpI